MWRTGRLTIKMGRGRPNKVFRKTICPPKCPIKKPLPCVVKGWVDTKTHQKTGNEEEKPSHLRICTTFGQVTNWHLLTVIQTKTVQGPTLHLMTIPSTDRIFLLMCNGTYLPNCMVRIIKNSNVHILTYIYKILTQSPSGLLFLSAIIWGYLIIFIYCDSLNSSHTPLHHDISINTVWLLTCSRYAPRTSFAPK